MSILPIAATSPSPDLTPGAGGRFAAALAALKRGIVRMAEALAEHDRDADPGRIAVLIKFPF